MRVRLRVWVASGGVFGDCSHSCPAHLGIGAAPRLPLVCSERKSSTLAFKPVCHTVASRRSGQGWSLGRSREGRRGNPSKALGAAGVHTGGPKPWRARRIGRLAITCRRDSSWERSLGAAVARRGCCASDNLAVHGEEGGSIVAAMNRPSFCQTGGPPFPLKGTHMGKRVHSTRLQSFQVCRALPSKQRSAITPSEQSQTLPRRGRAGIWWTPSWQRNQSLSPPIATARSSLCRPTMA